MIRESGVYALLMVTLMMNCGIGRVSMLTDHDAVTMSVFIYQMDHRPLKKDQQTYFLYVENNQDPEPSLIKRLKEKKYPIKPASQSQMFEDFIQDKEEKTFGILLSIRNRRCFSSKRCEVEGRIYENSDNAEVWRYEVAKESDLWVVKKAELISVS